MLSSSFQMNHQLYTQCFLSIALALYSAYNRFVQFSEKVNIHVCLEFVECGIPNYFESCDKNQKVF